MSPAPHRFKLKLTPIRTILVLIILTISALVVGQVSAKNKDMKPVAMPPVEVTVQKIEQQVMRTWTEFPGHMRAVDIAEIRPEVGGRITEIRFDDGQIVKAGDTLIVIDPRSYEANVAKANAALTTAKSNADFAQMELKRAEDLVRTKAIAQRVYDERSNSQRVAAAAVSAAEAELKQAKLDLEHAYVRAPITGRVSRAELTVGNLVQPGPGAPLLTTIVSSSGIYADFEVDEQTYLRTIRNGAVGRDAESKIPVELNAKGDKDHSYKGTIYSFDNKIDTNTGTIRARAKFSNEDGALIPGMFVTVRLASSVENSSILVPERAVSTDQDKKFVWVVGDDNKVVYREVGLGKAVDGGMRIVTSGLQPGERVIVDGLQHVMPNIIVNPKEVVAATANP